MTGKRRPRCLSRGLYEKGGYAEYAVTTAHSISRIPDAVTFEEAAALPTAGYTAYEALFRKLPMNHIQTILIHGGAGGVGALACSLLKTLEKPFSQQLQHIIMSM